MSVYRTIGPLVSSFSYDSTISSLISNIILFAILNFIKLCHIFRFICRFIFFNHNFAVNIIPDFNIFFIKCGILGLCFIHFVNSFLGKILCVSHKPCWLDVINVCVVLICTLYKVLMTCYTLINTYLLTVMHVKYTLSGNTLRVIYHLCIRHTLGTVFDLHHISENTHRYFHIIKTKKYVYATICSVIVLSFSNMCLLENIC